MKKFPALSLSNVVFILLINVEMLKIVGILALMSRTNFVLSGVEHEKKFINSGPVCIAQSEASWIWSCLL